MHTIREATPSDVGEILAVQDAALRHRAVDTYTDDQLSSIRPDTDDERGYLDLLASDGFEVLVATDVSVVGVGTVHTGDGQIHGLYAHPEHAEDGTGTRLLERLEKRTERANCTDLFALATLNAVGFYVERGYERVGEETVGSDPDIPVVRVEKTI